LGIPNQKNNLKKDTETNRKVDKNDSFQSAIVCDAQPENDGQTQRFCSNSPGCRTDQKKRRATTMASKEGMYLHRTRYESIHWLPMSVESHAELVPLDFDGENEFYGPTKPAFRTTAP
jgi:hypothetical protein